MRSRTPAAKLQPSWHMQCCGTTCKHQEAVVANWWYHWDGKAGDDTRSRPLVGAASLTRRAAAVQRVYQRVADHSSLCGILPQLTAPIWHLDILGGLVVAAEAGNWSAHTGDQQRLVGACSGLQRTAQPRALHCGPILLLGLGK
jgi:hypothetical protein